VNHPLPTSPIPPTFQSPNAELAAEIAQAFLAAGLINADDHALCENMLNGTAAAKANDWKFLLEIPLYTPSSTQPDAL
jgi:hypothetical protein